MDSIGSDKNGKAWGARAHELAAWARNRLVNRTDARGGYRPPEEWGKEYVTADGEVAKLGKTTTRKGGLTTAILRRHFAADDRRDVIGLHSTSTTNTSLWGALDIDWHGPTSTAPGNNSRAAQAWFARLRSQGFHPLLVDSNGQGGFHLWILLASAIATPRVYHFLRQLIADHRDYGMTAPPEQFPKQPEVRPQQNGKPGFGNWLRVPGRHHTREHWSRVWDGSRWLDGTSAIDVILALTGDSPDLIPPAPPPPPRPAPASTTTPPLNPGLLEGRIAGYMVKKCPNLGEGQGRDDVAFKFACFLARDLQLADADSLAWLERWDSGNSPPKGRDRLLVILADAHRYGRNAYGCGLWTRTVRRRPSPHKTFILIAER
jgi:hypothetical protein